MIISNACFIIAVFIFGWGFFKQIAKTKERRRVYDIEIRDVIARASAVTLMFVKFCFVGDLILIIGYGILLILANFYLILVIFTGLGKSNLLWDSIEDLQAYTKEILLIIIKRRGVRSGKND